MAMDKIANIPYIVYNYGSSSNNLVICAFVLYCRHTLTACRTSKLWWTHTGEGILATSADPSILTWIRIALGISEGTRGRNIMCYEWLTEVLKDTVNSELSHTKT